MAGQIGYSSSFAFQSTFKSSNSEGNFEVFIPWSTEGFGHFWFDGNDWHLPTTPIRANHILSLAVFESDYSSDPDNGDHGNFEMLAVFDGGSIGGMFRTNSAPFPWTPTSDSPHLDGPILACALCHDHKTYTRTQGHPWTHEFLYAVTSSSVDGLDIHWREQDYSWSTNLHIFELPANTVPSMPGHVPLNGVFTGLGWAVGTAGDIHNEWGDSTLGTPTLAATKQGGEIVCIENDQAIYEVEGQRGVVGYPDHQRWRKPKIVGYGGRGRPCLIQSDRGYAHGFFFFQFLRAGNFELAVPAAAGGILHYWRDNNSETEWHKAGVIGTRTYDEVAMFEERDEWGGEGWSRIHLFGWARGENYFDHFVQIDVGEVYTWANAGPVGKHIAFNDDPRRVATLLIERVVMHRTPQSGTWLMCLKFHTSAGLITYHIPDREYKGNDLPIYLSLEIPKIPDGETIEVEVSLDDDEVDVCTANAEDQSKGKFTTSPLGKQFLQLQEDWSMTIHWKRL